MKHKGLRKRMDTATLVISILSLLAASIAAIYAVITYYLSRKAFKFSLFDKRYQIYHSLSELIARMEKAEKSIGGVGESFLNQSFRRSLMFDLESLARQASFLFNKKITRAFKSGCEKLSSIAKVSEVKDKEWALIYELKEILHILLNDFQPYLEDKVFREPEPYCYDELINKFFGC